MILLSTNTKKKVKAKWWRVVDPLNFCLEKNVTDFNSDYFGFSTNNKWYSRVSELKFNLFWNFFVFFNYRFRSFLCDPIRHFFGRTRRTLKKATCSLKFKRKPTTKKSGNPDFEMPKSKSCGHINFSMFQPVSSAYVIRRYEKCYLLFTFYVTLTVKRITFTP